MSQAPIAVIEYALRTEEGLEFLKLWQHGQFDAIRKEWPDCPKACFVGVDDIPPETDEVGKAVDTLLDGAYWLPSLETKVLYSRRHDDTDGDTSAEQNLTVMFGPDADGYVTNGYGQVLRFREQFCGGGQSPRVRNALMVLAEAIRRDNESSPQRP